MRRRARILVRLSLALLAALSVRPARSAAAQELGTDIAGLNLCLYGDCEARGTYAADPFGMTNPGTMPVGVLPYLPRGVFFSGSYFRLNAGSVGLDVGAGSLTASADPWVFQVNVVYAEGSGGVRSLPGVDIHLRTRLVRLAAAVDLGRTALAVKGLSVGIIAGVPGTTSDVRLATGGFTVADSQENHEVGITGGMQWHGGQRDWFNVGALVNAERHHESTRTTDPFTSLSMQEYGVSNAWFGRAGLSLLPFVPLGLTEEPTPVSELLRETRVAADLEHRNISVPGEPTRAEETGYFGLDARVLPDAWNPVADYLRLYVIGGADTAGGWGVGAGLWGNGILEFASCNPGYSSRPLAKSLGDRVEVWAATCSIAVPL